MVREIASRSLLTAAGLSILFGCSKVENPSMKVLPPAKLDAGWKYYTVSAEGYSVAAPGGWTDDPNAYMGVGMEMEGMPQIPAEQLGPGMKSLAEETEKNNKEEARQLDEEYQKAGISLVLWDKQVRPIPGEERTRFYVKARDANGSLADEAKEMKQGLSDGKTTVEQKHVELPIGPAEAFMANTQNQGGDTVTNIVYVMVSGAKAYIVRFISTNSPERITTISNPVMQTFRIAK